MAVGSIKIEVEETVTEDVWVENGTDLATGVDEGGTLVAYTPSPGVRAARFKVTEEGSGPVIFSMTAGIK